MKKIDKAKTYTISNFSFCSLGNWDLERLNNLFNITPVLDVNSAFQTQEFLRFRTYTCLSDTWLLKYKYLYTLDNLLLTKMQLTFKGLNFWLNTKRPYQWSDLYISYQLISYLASQTSFILLFHIPVLLQFYSLKHLLGVGSQAKKLPCCFFVWQKTRLLNQRQRTIWPHSKQHKH